MRKSSKKPSTYYSVTKSLTIPWRHFKSYSRPCRSNRICTKLWNLKPPNRLSFRIITLIGPAWFIISAPVVLPESSTSPQVWPPFSQQPKKSRFLILTTSFSFDSIWSCNVREKNSYGYFEGVAFTFICHSEAAVTNGSIAQATANRFSFQCRGKTKLLLRFAESWDGVNHSRFRVD